MKKIITIIYYILFLVFKSAQSLIKVDITRGNLDPLPIAFLLYMLMKNQKNLII